MAHNRHVNSKKQYTYHLGNGLKLNQAQHEDKQHLVQSMTLAEIIASDIAPDTYPSLRDFQNTYIQKSKAVGSALQTSIHMFLTKDSS